MKTYAITATETVTKTVLVKADNLDAAIQKTQDAYESGQFDLVSGDFDNYVEFEASDLYKDGIYTGTKADRNYYDDLDDILEDSEVEY